MSKVTKLKVKVVLWCLLGVALFVGIVALMSIYFVD